MCDGHDIGISLDMEAESPRVFVYDNYPGGIGSASRCSGCTTSFSRPPVG